MNNQIKSASVRREVTRMQRQQHESTAKKNRIKTWEIAVLITTVVGLSVLVGWYCVTFGTSGNV